MIPDPVPSESRVPWRWLGLYATLIGVLVLGACWRLPDLLGGTDLEGWIRQILESAHRGRLFQRDVGQTINEPGWDLGVFWLTSVAAGLMHGLGLDTPALDPSFVHILQLGITMLVVAMLFHPAVPLRFSVALALLLLGHMFLDPPATFDSTFGISYYGYWAPPLAVLLTLAFLAALSWSPSPAGAMAGPAGLLVGTLGEWRIDAGYISRIAVVLWLLTLLLRLRLTPGRACNHWRRCLRPGTLFLAGSLVPGLILVGSLRIHQLGTGVPHFQEHRSTGHLFWHNLYLSLSSVEPNPRHISWNDRVGEYHSVEADPGLLSQPGKSGWGLCPQAPAPGGSDLGTFEGTLLAARPVAPLPGTEYLTRRYDRAMRDLYLSTAWEEPETFARAVIARVTTLIARIRPGILLLTLLAMAGMAVHGWCPRDRVPGPGAGPGPWPDGVWILVSTIAAASLPPLLYSAWPQYSHAVVLAVRGSLAFVLATWIPDLALRSDSTPDDPETRTGDLRLLRGLAGVLVITLVTAGILFGTASYWRCARVSRLSGDPGRFYGEYMENRGRLRGEVESLPETARAALARDLPRRFGLVKGGGTLLQRPEDLARGEILHVAWVGSSLVVALRAGKSWPAPGFEAEGGFLEVVTWGPWPRLDRWRIPGFRPGETRIFLIPAPAGRDRCEDLELRLRLEGFRLEEGLSLGHVMGLTRTQDWTRSWDV